MLPNKVYRRRTYNRQRQELLRLLGGHCVFCRSTEELEFHHPHGKSWQSKNVCSTTRLLRYKDDYERGNLELRCKLHHDELRKKEVYDPEPVPF